MMDKKSNLFTRLRKKYILTFSDAESFDELYRTRISRRYVINRVVFSVILYSVILVSLIFFTPLRSYVPGYPSKGLKDRLLYNAILIDSLNYELQLRDKYFATINDIMSGNEPTGYSSMGKISPDSSGLQSEFLAEDELFRNPQQSEASSESMQLKRKKKDPSLVSLYFYPPVKGIVTKQFDLSKNHFGTDIVTGNKEIVKSILAGTVTLSTWTLETGNIIQVQHENDLVSVYKHNASLLKEVGQIVEAGESIAVVGNSGEMTTGPHLHFELWHQGAPIDPELYISF